MLSHSVFFDSVTHGLYLTKLLCPWESPGKNVICLVAQSCLTLCDPMDCSLPGSSVHEDSPGGMLEWVAMPSSRALGYLGLPKFLHKCFPGGSRIKNSPANAGDMDSITQSRRSPGGGHGNPLQYSCLENPMDRGAWWATVHGVSKSQT